MSPASDGIKPDIKKSPPVTPFIFLGVALLMFVIATITNVSTSWATSLLPGWNKLDIFHSNKSQFIQLFVNYCFAYPAIIVGLGGLFFLNPLVTKRYPSVSILNLLGLTFFISSSLVIIIYLLFPENLVNQRVGGGWTVYPPISQGDNFNPKTIMKGFTYYKILSAMPFIALAINLSGQLLVVLNIIISIVKRGLPDFIKNHSRIIKVYLIAILSGFILLCLNGIFLSGVISKAVLLPQSMFDPTRGGDPILFQHIYWFIGNNDLIPIFWMAGAILLTLLIKDDNRKWIRIFPYTMLFIYIIYIAYHILGQIYNQMASHYKSNNYNEQWFVLLSLFIPAIILLTLSLIQLKGRLKELFTRFKETILRTAILFAVSLFLVLILDWLRVGILLGPSLFLYFLMALGVSLFSAFFRISHLWAGGFITLFILWVILYLFQSGGSHKILSSQVIITSIQDILIYYATPFSAIYMTIAYLYPGLYASKWRDTLARFHFILSHILLLALVIFQLWYYLIIKFQAGDLLPASRDLMAKENDKLLAYMTYGLFFTQLIWLMNLIYGVIRGDLTRRLPQHSKQALSR